MQSALSALLQSIMISNYLVTNGPLSFIKHSNENTSFSAQAQGCLLYGKTECVCVPLCVYTYVVRLTREYSLCE